MSSRTLAQNIAKLSADVTNAYIALAAKGATIPASKTTDALSATIDTVQQGDEPVYGVSSQKQILGNPDGTWTGIEQFRYHDTRTSAVTPDRMFAGNPCISSYESDVSSYYYDNQCSMACSFKDCINLVNVRSCITSDIFTQRQFVSAFIGCDSLTAAEFPNLQAVGQYGFYSAFQDLSSFRRFEAPLLTSIANYGFQNAFRGTAISSLDFGQVKSVGTYGLGNAVYDPTVVTNFDFSELTSIGNYGMYQMNTKSTNMSYHLAPGSFEKLTQVGASGMYQAFSRNNSLNMVDISFPELTSVGSQGMYHAFYGNYNLHLSSLSFPKLKSIGDSGLTYAFYQCNCADASALNFPELTSVGSSGFSNCFQKATDYRTMPVISCDFPKLTTVSRYAFSHFYSRATSQTGYKAGWIGTFSNLTTLTADNVFAYGGLYKGYFPKLSNIGTNSVSFQHAQSFFEGPRELHFAATNETAIKATAGWSTQWGAGAGTFTIYFDL